jgi:calmodulin
MASVLTGEGDSMQIGSIGGGMAMGPSQAMRDRMFKKVDSNGDGSVSLDEFKALASNKRGGPDPLSSTDGESVEDLFSSFDADGDGSLSQSELDTGMAARMQAFADQLKAAMFAKADTNGDGSLSAEEFAAMRPPKRATAASTSLSVLA